MQTDYQRNQESAMVMQIQMFDSGDQDFILCLSNGCPKIIARTKNPTFIRVYFRREANWCCIVSDQ